MKGQWDAGSLNDSISDGGVLVHLQNHRWRENHPVGNQDPKCSTPFRHKFKVTGSSGLSCSCLTEPEKLLLFIF